MESQTLVVDPDVLDHVLRAMQPDSAQRRRRQLVSEVAHVDIVEHIRTLCRFKWDRALSVEQGVFKGALVAGASRLQQIMCLHNVLLDNRKVLWTDGTWLSGWEKGGFRLLVGAYGIWSAYDDGTTGREGPHCLEGTQGLAHQEAG